MRKLVLLLGLVLALGAIAGCASQTSAAPVATAHVEMPPSYRFDPPIISVNAGTTVTWHNSDNFTHSVKVLKGDYPYLELKPGQTGQITFNTPGEYDYICTFHSQDMKGRVIVK